MSAISKAAAATVASGAVAIAALVVLWHELRGRLDSDNHIPHIVLVGASIGQDWNLEEYGSRTGERRVSIEAVQAWQFDKSDVLEQVLLRPKLRYRPTLGFLRALMSPRPRRPSMIILKECSSYFPSDNVQNLRLMARWVQATRSAGIDVMIATTVPITAARDAKSPGKQEGLLAFNSALRSFAAEQGIRVVDLEAATQISQSQPFLKDEYDYGDGSHLNAAAYKKLDRVLQHALCEWRPEELCNDSRFGALTTPPRT